MNKSAFFSALSLTILSSFGVVTAQQSNLTNASRADESRVILSADSNYTTLSDTFNLSEVVVMSLRVDKKIRNTPASVAVVPSFTFLKRSAFTLSNVAATEPGLFMGGDGIWSTSLNLHGFSENRLITLIDGNRVETATDLTASLSMIDVNDVDHVEIIKGAQSSLYGTGAMGGIINVITKTGRFAERRYLDADLTSSFAFVNRYTSTNLALAAGGKRWYARLSGTYGDASNVMTPLGEMPNSGFTTSNLSAKVGFKPVENHLLKIQYQRNHSTDVGIPGGEAFPGPADASYARIDRNLFDLAYEVKGLSDRFSALKLNLFYQNNLREVEVHPNTVSRTEMANGNTQVTAPQLLAPGSLHSTYGALLQTTFDFSTDNTLIAGADYFRRDLVTSRVKQITVNILKPTGDTLKTNYVERYETPIPASSSSTLGLFAQDETRLLDNRLLLTLGGRFDWMRVENEACYDVDKIVTNGVENETLPTQRLTYEAGMVRDNSWSANLGLLYKVTPRTDLLLNVNRSYRAPSIEERFKFIDLGNSVRLGDPNLKPEKGYSADLGFRYWGQRFSLQGSLYANRISNMIVERQGEFYTVLTATNTPDTIPALVNANVNDALLYGFDVKAEYNLSANFNLSLSGSYVRGKDLNSEAGNLPLIQPANGRLSGRYTLPAIGSAELTLAAVAKQDKIAAGESVTSGYLRLDLALNSVAIPLFNTCEVRLIGGVDNLTNTTYTNHLSTNRGSISVEPARNLYLKLRISHL